MRWAWICTLMVLGLRLGLCPAYARMPGLEQEREPELVARVQFRAPSGPRLVLRTVLPVPHTFDATCTLLLRFPQIEEPVQAQFALVTRSATGLPETIELIASVPTAPQWRAGATLVASVERLSAAAAPSTLERTPRLDPQVRELLQPSAVPRFYLRTQDVYGQTYSAELTGAPASLGLQTNQPLVWGPHALRRRLAAVLIPTAPVAPQALPHAMGVHAYLTQRAGVPAVSLDLRIHNGLVSPTTEPHVLDAPLGPVWVRAVELVLPSGWTADPDGTDPYIGPARSEGDQVVVPLVAPLADGQLHCLPSQAHFQRRLVVRRVDAGWAGHDSLRFRDVGFPVAGAGLWSWESLARWFPQREQLPSASLYATKSSEGAQVYEAREALELRRIEEYLRSGKPQSYPYQAQVMGWAQPFFEPQQGATGGVGIVLSEGHWVAVTGAPSGLPRIALQHRMNAARQPQAAWDRHGRPWSCELALTPADADGTRLIPFDYRLNGDIRLPSFAGRAAAHPAALAQGAEVERRGLRPSWDRGDPYASRTKLAAAGANNPDNVHAWWPHDDQHYVRWTAPAKALVWLANDALAKDDLLLAAELGRLALHEYPHTPVSWSKGATLAVLRQEVEARPHSGLPFGRGQAWIIDAMGAAHAVANDSWRATHDAWCVQVTQLMLDAAPSTGLVMRVHNTRHPGHERYDTAQAFESMLLLHAGRVLAEGVHGEARPTLRAALRHLHLVACTSLFQPPLWQAEQDRQGNLTRGPRQIFAVARKGEPTTDFDASWPPRDGQGGGVEVYWSWSALAHALNLCPPPATESWRQRLLQLSSGFDRTAAVYAEFQRSAANPSHDNSANALELLHWLQTRAR